MTSDYVLSHFDAMALWDAVLDFDREDPLMNHVIKSMTLDSGQRVRIYDDGQTYAMEYECSNCSRFTPTDDGYRHSHFDGETWRPGFYCGACIELVV